MSDTSNNEYSDKMNDLITARAIGGANLVKSTVTPSTTTEYVWQDYEETRYSERMPKTIQSLMSKSQEAYYKNPYVRVAFDLIADLACDGIAVHHPNKTIDRFYQALWKHVKGEHVSNQLALSQLKFANSFIKRTTAIINDEYLKELKKEQKFKVQSQKDDKKSLNAPVKPSAWTDELVPVYRQEIPRKYTFINPTAVRPVYEELAGLVNQNVWEIVIPSAQVRKSKKKDPKTQKLFADIDPELLKQIQNGVVALEPKNLRVFHYRKSDWDVMARPILETVIDDLILYNKLQLAEQAACDGACSQLNLWKLGRPELGAMPGPTIVDAFANMLKINTGGGPKHMVWGPDVELIQTTTNLHNFLGEEKFRNVIKSIRLGLGLPAVLVDASTGVTNAFMSVQILIKRINYIRSQLAEFWDEEFKLVQKSLGHQKPAKLVFNSVDFNDPNAEKAVWVQLLDRNVISIEDMREKIGKDNDITEARVADEYSRMGEGEDIPPKSSPFHDAQPELALKKIVEQKKVPPGAKPTSENTKPGRPRNARDTKQRKQRTPKTQAQYRFADLIVDSKVAYDELEKLILAAKPNIDEVAKNLLILSALIHIFSLPIFSLNKEVLMAGLEAPVGVAHNVMVENKLNNKDAVCLYITMEKLNG